LALYFPDTCIGAGTPLYLKFPEDATSAPKYVGVIQKLCTVCNPVMCICLQKQ